VETKSLKYKKENENQKNPEQQNQNQNIKEKRSQRKKDKTKLIKQNTVESRTKGMQNNLKYTNGIEFS
jgi:hypothetical protein